MATALKTEYLAPAPTPAKPVLRLVEADRLVPPSWMFAPKFRMDDALANPAFVAKADLDF